MRRLDHSDTHFPGPDAARQAVVRLVGHHHRRVRESPSDQFFYRTPAFHRCYLPPVPESLIIQAGPLPVVTARPTPRRIISGVYTSEPTWPGIRGNHLIRSLVPVVR
jgi:hypothetical protein